MSMAHGRHPTKSDVARTPRQMPSTEVLSRKKSGFSTPVREWVAQTSAKDLIAGKGMRSWACSVYRRFDRQLEGDQLVTGVDSQLLDETAPRLLVRRKGFGLPSGAVEREHQVGAKAFGWEKRHATGDPRPGPIKNGFGVSAHQWGGGGRGGRAHVDITSDGSVVMKVGTQDLGTGTRTMVATGLMSRMKLKLSLS